MSSDTRGILLWMLGIVIFVMYGFAFSPSIPWPIKNHERKVSFPDCPEAKFELSIARHLINVWCSQQDLSPFNSMDVITKPEEKR